MAESKITISSINRGPVTTQVDIRGMKVDFYHGSENHISPVEYVLAALAGCMNGVGYRVARDMGIELKGIDIKIDATIDISRLTGEKTDMRAGLKEVNVQICPDIDADEETKKTWLENLEFRCPVNDIISNPTPVNVKLV
ncbi:MAG: OsmC family protein [Eubacteriaceae bacterium]|nr:OsmC family protein [Eubacteriaceae bacterium]